MRRALLALASLSVATGVPLSAQMFADLMAVARPVADILVLANDYVRIHHEVFEYPAAEPRISEARPAVLYIRVAPRPGVVNTRLLTPPKGARPVWRRGVVPRGVRVEVLKPPPQPSALGEPGTNPPGDAITDAAWDGGQLILATFRSLDYGVGTGPLPSVTTFLSGGIVDYTSRGVRRRMLVAPGDTFWFDARTRLTVTSDEPIGAAIVQLSVR